MLADLVVLSTDILETRAALATARVAYTIFDGKIVYRADRGTN
jgi:predicted amidohydrolase YtcJ